jgi:hypothetical protein
MLLHRSGPIQIHFSCYRRHILTNTSYLLILTKDYLQISKVLSIVNNLFSFERMIKRIPNTL